MEKLLSSLIAWISKFGGQYAIVMIGNSGSGKSTLAAELAKRLNIEVVSSDAIRVELSPTGSVLDQSRMVDVWLRVYQRIAAVLNGGRCVLVDATNAKSSDRRKMVSFLQEHNVTVLGVWMDTPLEVCLQRNAKWIEPIKCDALRDMRDYLEGIPVKKRGIWTLSTRPSLADGFTGLWRVDVKDIDIL